MLVLCKKRMTIQDLCIEDVWWEGAEQHRWNFTKSLAARCRSFDQSARQPIRHYETSARSSGSSAYNIAVSHASEDIT